MLIHRRLRSHGLTVVDQAISSLGNFILVAAVARITKTDEFGAFALAYLVYGLGLFLFRAACGDVLLLRTRSGVDDRESIYGGFLAVAIALGAAIGLLVAGVALVAGGDLRAPMLALAVVFPVVLAQDGFRYSLISGGQSGSAALADGVWLFLQLGAFVAASAAAVLQSGAGLLLLWGGTSLISTGVAFVRLRVGPRPAELRPWLIAGGGRMKALAADFFVFSGTIYAGLYAVPLVASLAVLAALRAAQLLFAPFEVMMNGARLITLPAVANAIPLGRARYRRRAGMITLVFAGVAAAWGLLVVALPNSIGEAVLGQNWSVAEPLLPAYAIGYVAAAASASAMDGVRSAGGARRIVVARLLTGLLQGGGILLGVAIGGGQGGATGFALGMWLGFFVWVWSARHLGGVPDRIDDQADSPVLGL